VMILNARAFIQSLGYNISSNLWACGAPGHGARLRSLG